MNSKILSALSIVTIAALVFTVQSVSFASSKTLIKPLPKGYQGPPMVIKIKPIGIPKPKGCIVEIDKRSPAKSNGCLQFYEND